LNNDEIVRRVLSDLDLPAVEPVLANTHERSVEIRGALGEIGFPVDVIVMRTERFERTKRVIGGIAYPANKYGRVIMKPLDPLTQGLVRRVSTSAEL
jgi:hypothetical protein